MTYIGWYAIKPKQPTKQQTFAVIMAQLKAKFAPIFQSWSPLVAWSDMALPLSLPPLLVTSVQACIQGRDLHISVQIAF